GELEQGIEALERGNVEAAVQHLRRASRQTPEDYRPLVGLGIAYGECRRLKDAVRAFRQAVQRQPTSAPAHYNLGLGLERSRRPAEALQELEKALALNPQHARARNALARVAAELAVADAALPAPPAA